MRCGDGAESRRVARKTLTPTLSQGAREEEADGNGKTLTPTLSHRAREEETDGSGKTLTPTLSQRAREEEVGGNGGTRTPTRSQGAREEEAGVWAVRGWGWLEGSKWGGFARVRVFSKKLLRCGGAGEEGERGEGRGVRAGREAAVAGGGDWVGVDWWCWRGRGRGAGVGR